MLSTADIAPPEAAIPVEARELRQATGAGRAGQGVSLCALIDDCFRRKNARSKPHFRSDDARCLIAGRSRLFAAARWRRADLWLYQKGREHQLRCSGIKMIMNMRDMPAIIGMQRHIVGDRCCTSASTNL